MYIPRPLIDIEAFKNGLPDAKFVDGDKVVWGCRMFKSPLEVERMKRAAQVIHRMHAAVAKEFRPGMSEMDVAKICHHIQIESGDIQGGDTAIISHIICGGEKEGMLDVLAHSEVTITAGDYLQLDLMHKHRGYWAYVVRQFQVGPVTDEMERYYQLCAEGMENALSIIKPGVRCCDVFEAAVKPETDAGLEPPFGMAGHGIGMDILEPPSIDSTNEAVLEEGMTFSLETWLITGLRRHGGSGLFGYEEQYVITENGYETVGAIDKRINQVLHPFSG
ncbi:MAG: aminopeptidase P family protein [Deltaproteobacteria bacterium]|nr:aminopeptidase P family protein [Deltaproteobacteria bacterium]